MPLKAHYTWRIDMHRTYFTHEIEHQLKLLSKLLGQIKRLDRDAIGTDPEELGSLRGLLWSFVGHVRALANEADGHLLELEAFQRGEFGPEDFYPLKRKYADEESGFGLRHYEAEAFGGGE